ncbi:MAG TPA: FCD domain-containing protein [Methylomirabilota bacterium]|nr:FCD domain-containing protein [Methylomirabilota bacterium]
MEHIEHAAYGGLLKPGDRLPTERELAARLGVSRACVREAVRALELRGLVEVRRGVKGGQFITKLNSRVLARELGVLFRLHRMAVADFAETRLIIEPEVARLAALRATAADLHALQEVLDARAAAAAAGKPLHTLDVAFHRRVAEAAGNPLQTFLIHTLMDLESDVIRSGHALGVEEQAQVGLAHRQLFAALAARDSHRAHSLMRAHLSDLRQRLARAEGRKAAAGGAPEAARLRRQAGA